MDAATTMSPPAASAGSPGWMIWTGRVLSARPILALVVSSMMKMSHNPAMLKDWSPTFGFAEDLLIPIGVTELICAILTAYLGGAVVTHVRVGQMFLLPLLLAVFAWGGLFLRDRRLRALLPLRWSP